MEYAYARNYDNDEMINGSFTKFEVVKGQGPVVVKNDGFTFTVSDR